DQRTGVRHRRLFHVPLCRGPGKLRSARATAALRAQSTKCLQTRVRAETLLMADFVYCLNSSTIRPTPILKKIEIAGQAGYAAIELWHDDIDAHLARGGTLKELRHALDDRQLAVPTTIYLKGWFETTGPEH